MQQPSRRLVHAVLTLGVGFTAAAFPMSISHTSTRTGIPGFEIICFYTKSAMDDPIVFPRRPGAAHMHDFAGNTTTDAYSTADSLRGHRSTCELTGDTAAYWVPTLYSNGTPIHPDRLHAYYRWGNVANLQAIRPLPAGLKVIAGDAHATKPQSTAVIGWNCGVQGQRQYDHPISCNSKQKIVLHVFFPNCWDGRHLDSPDHKSHMAYSSNGKCPAGHPVIVPRLSEAFGYPISSATGLTFSSGQHYTAHADFINSWNQSEMNRLTTTCINASRQCGPVDDAHPHGNHPSSSPRVQSQADGEEPRRRATLDGMG